MNKPVCCEAQLFIGTPLTVFFSIFATSNIDIVVSILHKTYLIEWVLIHIKSQSLCQIGYGHLHPEYAAYMVASSEYYHCHWILLILCITWFYWWLLWKRIEYISRNVHTVSAPLWLRFTVVCVQVNFTHNFQGYNYISGKLLSIIINIRIISFLIWWRHYREIFSSYLALRWESTHGASNAGIWEIAFMLTWASFWTNGR